MDTDTKWQLSYSASLTPKRSDAPAVDHTPLPVSNEPQHSGRGDLLALPLHGVSARASELKLYPASPGELMVLSEAAT